MNQATLTSAATLLIWGVLIHLVCDWLLQSDWMATNKANLKHLAGYVHASIHTIGLLLVFPWFVAVIVGITHLFIDTRIPLKYWGELCVNAPTDPSNPVTLHIAMWRDQVLHMLIIGLAALSVVYWHLLPNL